MTSKKPQKNSQQKLVRPNRGECQGLPDHAQFQARNGTWYVYFPYDYSIDGKRYQDRDYIGKLDAENNFVPNLYYVQNEPRFENRPVDRWRNPIMKERALAKLQKKVEVKTICPVADLLDPDVDADQRYSVGATALAVAILIGNKMLQDLHETLDGNLRDTMHCANLAVHAAITSDKTYLAASESVNQKFIGTGCPSSPHASELFQRIGSGAALSSKMAHARARHVQHGQLCALDSARIDSFSKNINSAASGLRKDGTFSPWVNLSLLINVETGDPICYRYYSGNCAGSATLDDFRTLLSDVGISEKRPTFLMDHGYPSYKEFIKLNDAGLKFLVSARSSMAVIRKVIHERNSDFYNLKTYVRNQYCYGIKSSARIKCADRHMDVKTYVFRSPQEEMKASDELITAVEQFAGKWLEKTSMTKSDREMLRFFVSPELGIPLVVDWVEISNECYRKGYFGFVGNVDLTLPEALATYRRRNEVEVTFKLMLQNLMRTTRVHSSQAFEGLMMTGFVGLSVLSYLCARLPTYIKNERTKDPQGSTIGGWWTIQELLKELRRIKLAHSKDGTPRLIGVTKRDQDLVAALGFPGLFDSADEVMKLLSAKGLAEMLK